jgi:hypothetical protein
MAGVEVAAPIAMIGYTFEAGDNINVPLPRAAVAGRGRELYRVTTT